MMTPHQEIRWARLTVPWLLALLALMGTRASADWIYDCGGFYNRGIAIGAGMSTQMLAQPAIFPCDVYANQIGVAIAGAQDPNSVGFKVILTSDLQDVYGSRLGDWNLLPVDGPVFAFAYASFQALRLDANRTYYLVMAPGDAEFAGAVAHGWYGNLALASPDYGSTWFEVAQLGVRIGGSPVPEPSGLLAVGGSTVLSAVGLATRRLKTRPRRTIA